MPRFPFPFPRPKPPDNPQLDRIQVGINALIANDKLLIAAINNPAWLSPPPAPATARIEGATVYLPVVDVGGQVYMRIAGVQTSVDNLKGAIMLELDNLTAQVAATLGAEQSAIVALDAIKAELDALAVSGASPAQIQALADQLQAGIGPLADAIARDNPPAP